MGFAASPNNFTFDFISSLCLLYILTFWKAQCAYAHSLAMAVIFKVHQCEMWIWHEALQLNWMYKKNPLLIGCLIQQKQQQYILIKTAAFYNKSIKGGGRESRHALISAHLGEGISIKVEFHNYLFFCGFLYICNQWSCISHCITTGNEAEHN